MITANPGDVLPVMATRGVTLSPGLHTEVKVKAVERTRLGPPHGNCSTNIPERLLPEGQCDRNGGANISERHLPKN